MKRYVKGILIDFSEKPTQRLGQKKHNEAVQPFNASHFLELVREHSDFLLLLQ